MSEKHTPGPWEVDSDVRGTVAKKGHGTRLSIATVHGGFGETTRRGPNARLIAAAPELLESLQRIAELSYDSEAVRVAREAIASATGDQP